jgi:hypothetical protein
VYVSELLVPCSLSNVPPGLEFNSWAYSFHRAQKSLVKVIYLNMLHSRVLYFKDSPVLTYCLQITLYYSLLLFIAPLTPLPLGSDVLSAHTPRCADARTVWCSQTTVQGDSHNTQTRSQSSTREKLKHNAQATFYIDTFAYNDLRILH